MNLKPCPFCGSKEATIQGRHGNRRNWWVQCDDCYACAGACPDQAVAISAWNDRADVTPWKCSPTHPCSNCRPAPSPETGTAAEPVKPPATCASWCGEKTDGALVFCSDACFVAHARVARSPAAGTAPPLAFGMRTAREVAAEVWDSLKRGENVIDMYAAAIEQDRREMIAACREVAEEGVCSFGTDYSARCAHTACAVKRTIGRRIRSLVPPPGGSK